MATGAGFPLTEVNAQQVRDGLLGMAGLTTQLENQYGPFDTILTLILDFQLSAIANNPVPDSATAWETTTLADPTPKRWTLSYNPVNSQTRSVTTRVAPMGLSDSNLEDYWFYQRWPEIEQLTCAQIDEVIREIQSHIDTNYHLMETVCNLGQSMADVNCQEVEDKLQKWRLRINDYIDQQLRKCIDIGFGIGIVPPTVDQIIEGEQEFTGPLRDLNRQRQPFGLPLPGPGVGSGDLPGVARMGPGVEAGDTGEPSGPTVGSEETSDQEEIITDGEPEKPDDPHKYTGDQVIYTGHQNPNEKPADRPLPDGSIWIPIYWDGQWVFHPDYGIVWEEPIVAEPPQDAGRPVAPIVGPVLPVQPVVVDQGTSGGITISGPEPIQSQEPVRHVINASTGGVYEFPPYSPPTMTSAENGEAPACPACPPPPPVIINFAPQIPCPVAPAPPIVESGITYQQTSAGDSQPTSTANGQPTGEPSGEAPVAPLFSGPDDVGTDETAGLGIRYELPSVATGLWATEAACVKLNPIKLPDYSDWEAFFGWKQDEKEKDKRWAPQWVYVFTKVPFWGKALSDAVGNLWMYVTYQSYKIVNTLNCDVRSILPDVLMLQLSRMIDKHLGGIFCEITKGFWYNIHYACPQLIPERNDCLALFLTNQITENTFRCLIKANNYYDTWQVKLANGMRMKADIRQLITLNRLGKLQPHEYDFLTKETGIKNPADLKRIEQATQWFPTPPDIVRFMVRDTGDQDVVDDYKLDFDFTKKFSPELAKWAAGSGVTAETMVHFWRAHWEMPSNTALYEMLHRLRPVRRKNVVDKNLWVTPDIAKTALEVNDNMPGWVPRLMAISYKPLTRVDTQRAYMIGKLDDDELFDSYMDLGYNEINAGKLVEFTQGLKAKRDKPKRNGIAGNRVLAAYKRCLITNKKAAALLAKYNYDPKDIPKLIDQADSEREIMQLNRCSKSVGDRFLAGEIREESLAGELLNIGIPKEQVACLAAQLQCEKKAKGKDLTQAQLCKAFDMGIIGEPELTQKLLELGYSEEETDILVKLCTGAMDKKKKKAAADKARIIDFNRRLQEELLKNPLLGPEEVEKAFKDASGTPTPTLNGQPH